MPIKWNESPSKLDTVPSMLRDEMNDLVDDMVGAQVDPSNLRFIPLLLLEYTLST
jgi:hypothetical protein